MAEQGMLQERDRIGKAEALHHLVKALAALADDIEDRGAA